MKILLNGMKSVVMVAALALMGAPAQAGLMINGTDVGVLDTVIGAIDSANSGQAYEESQLETILGSDVTLLSNIDVSGSPSAENGNRFIDVNPNTPGYYVLKFGNGSNPIDMLFMQNNEFLRYLAWSDAQMIANGIASNHVQSLSHYAITSSNGRVPEPSSLVLLGLGLLGFAIRNRWRSTQS